MKSDLMSKRILAVGVAVSAVLVSASLFMFSIQPASASGDSNDPTMLMSPPATTGSIMMDYTSVHVPAQDKTYYECMVWDSQTGKSKLYFYSYADKKFKAYEENVQLPTYPLD